MSYHGYCDTHNMALKVARHQHSNYRVGGGPKVVVSTAAFHAIVRGSVHPSTCESQHCGEPPR